MEYLMTYDEGCLDMLISVPPALKVLGTVATITTGWTVAVISRALETTPTLAITLSISTAVAVGYGLKRIVTSMIRAANETIDGLRRENDRLRGLLKDTDTGEHH